MSLDSPGFPDRWMLLRMKDGQHYSFVCVDTIHEPVRESGYRPTANLELQNLHGLGILAEQNKFFAHASNETMAQAGLGFVVAAANRSEISFRCLGENDSLQSGSARISVIASCAG